MDLVDIHSHLLWGLDDGCRTPEETLEAARALASLGYTDAAPSPHAQARYAGGDPAACARRLEEARALVAGAGIPLRLHRNAENPADAFYFASLERGEARGIGEVERFALVEFPFLDEVEDVAAAIARVRARGVLPIVAHPERCQVFGDPARVAEAIRAGAALQLNIGSLIGRHGPMAQVLSERFLSEGLYAVGGTDLHGPSDAADWIDEALTALEGRAGRAELVRICSDNPRRALAGEALR
jgi:protein-tyrosine phosphatase